ncbi:hypothetical protein ACHAWF_007458 [Thalassiosira exigua]
MNAASAGFRRFGAAPGLRSRPARNPLRRDSSTWPPAKATDSIPGKERAQLHRGNSSRCSRRNVHGDSAGPPPSAFRRRLGEWRRNGSPEIAVGVAILGLVGVERLLQARDENQREDVYRRLEREVRRDEEASRAGDEKLTDEGGAAAEIKFKCVVRKVPRQFDGHKCLKDVRVGDVVGVLEENVGPGGGYNLCSVERGNPRGGDGDSVNDGQKVSVGWFPCSCLQKIE